MDLRAGPGPRVRPRVSCVHLAARPDSLDGPVFLPPSEPIVQAVIHESRGDLVRIEHDPRNGTRRNPLDPNPAAAAGLSPDHEASFPSPLVVRSTGKRTVDLSKDPFPGGDHGPFRPRHEFLELLAQMILPERAHVADRGDGVSRFPLELEVNDQILRPGNASACESIWLVAEIPNGFASCG